jgi:hypothetical protein
MFKPKAPSQVRLDFEPFAIEFQAFGPRTHAHELFEALNAFECRAEFFVGQLQFRRPLAHPLFEFLIHLHIFERHRRGVRQRSQNSDLQRGGLPGRGPICANRADGG